MDLPRETLNEVLRQANRAQPLSFSPQTLAYFPPALAEAFAVKAAAESAPPTRDAISRRLAEALSTTVHNVLMLATTAQHDSQVRSPGAA